MNITGTTSAYAYPSVASTRSSSLKPSEDVPKTNALAETVEKKSPPIFSESARTASQQAPQAETLPDEAYAIPSWQTGYYVDVTNWMTMGATISELDGKSAKYFAASGADKAEYNSLFQTHLEDLYKSNGLSDAGDRYRATKSIPGLNEKLHQQFTESVKNDPKMVSLMSKLGFEIS